MSFYKIELAGRRLQSRTNRAIRRFQARVVAKLADLRRRVLGAIIPKLVTDGELCAILDASTCRPHQATDPHFYVYRLTPDGAYVYERTCGTEHAATIRLRELETQGVRAIWLKNHTIRGAFY